MTSSVPPYRKLSPAQWRRMLARAAVFHATRGRLGRLCELTHDAAVRAVLAELDRAVRTCARGDTDDRAMVAAVVRTWVASFGEIQSWEDIAPDTAELLADLQEAVGSACAENPFEAIFTRIVSLSSQLYGDSWRPATLTVAHLRKHPRESDVDRDPYAVTALTPWPREVPAEILLWIYDDGFGPAAYAAIPILLIHECVCHVAASQEEAKNDSQFAEGFLAWAGYHFLRIWAAQLDPLSAAAVQEHADRLGQVLADRAEPTERKARNFGKLAARELHSWFQSECQLGPEESGNRVAMLAVELNRAERPIAEKDRFVSLLKSPFPPRVHKKLRDWNDGLATSDELLDLGLPA